MTDTNTPAPAAPTDKSFYDCRMYEQELPNQDDLVVVRVNKVEDFGAYVTLLEYNNIEGMILSSEVSRKRIRSIHKHLRINKQDVMQVLRVDKDKGYIDLSKKYVNEDQVKSATEAYTKSKTVHSIMKHVAVTCSVDLLTLLQKVAWPLYKKYKVTDEENEDEEAPRGHALDGLVEILDKPEILNDMDLDESVKDCLLKEIKHRLAEQPIRVQSQIELNCFTSEGVEAIKAALMAGKKYAEDNNHKLEVNLLSTPVYRLTTQCTDKQQGVDTIKEATKIIEEEIKKRKGNFLVKEEPQEV